MRSLIIAEAGVNHNGSLELAQELVRVAAQAGVDYVKFQSFTAEELASTEAAKANYQLKASDGTETQLQMLKKLELSKEAHQELIRCCRQSSVSFLSSPFGVADLEMLLSLGIDRIKLPSGEITNYPLLRKAGQSGLPVILSTGMS